MTIDKIPPLDLTAGVLMFLIKITIMTKIKTIPRAEKISNTMENAFVHLRNIMSFLLHEALPVGAHSSSEQWKHCCASEIKVQRKQQLIYQLI